MTTGIHQDPAASGGGSGAGPAETATARPGTPAHLPEERGPLSAAVLDLAGQQPGDAAASGGRWPSPRAADPFGDDLQLALCLAYELHYHGLPGLPDSWEWDPELLRFRAGLEQIFLDGLRGAVAGGESVQSALDGLLVEPVEGAGVPHYLEEYGDWPQMREFLVHRSIYQLKEGDPQAWVIPRLQGRPKAAVVAVEYDEYGAGRAEHLHARMFAELMRGAGLEPDYLHYLDTVPAPALAVVNMMSLFGLHREFRGASVGHFAAAEISTAPAARRIAAGLRRLGAPGECVRFYTEHIEADAVHEQVLRRDVVGGLLEQDPGRAADVVLGIQATELLEDRFRDHLLGAWENGVSSLWRPVGPVSPFPPGGPAASTGPVG